MTDEATEKPAAVAEVQEEEMEAVVQTEETEQAAAAESTDAAAAESTEGGDEAETTEDGASNPSGGGKGGRNFNRGGKRYTPYSRNNRAVYHQSDNSDPSCRVYVGNLAWEVTWKELKDHMKKSDCDIVRADVLASPDGRSKGCGIVEFASADGAKRALMLNDSELMGRQIFVREDRESGSGGGYYTQQPGGAGASGGNAPSGGGGGGRPASGVGGGSNSGAGGAHGGSETQSCRVYVGNLSWDVAWQDLKDHMRDAGDVVYAEVMQDGDGRSKGCGVVEYKSTEEAQEAIKTLSDTELKGRMLFVREDRETSNTRSSGSSVYVGNLAYETSWQDLKDHMRQAGNVDQANVLSSDDGRSKGCGIVTYQNARDAARAIRELQNSVLHGRPIFVREDREQGGGGGGGRGGGRDSNRRRGGGRGRGRGGYSQGYGGGGDGGGASGCALFVGNLSYDTSWRELKDHFRQCGDVDRVEVPEGPDGRKKGFGTVRFYKEADAQHAIQTLNGVELQGRELEVREDQKAR